MNIQIMSWYPHNLHAQVEVIVGLHPQSPCHFAWQPSALVLCMLQPSYLSHMMTAAT
jgi:hypothetical protein